MATSSCNLFLLLSLLLPFISCAAVNDPINLYCGKNLTAGATAAAEVLQSSLNRVLPDLVTRTPTDGYAISSYGVGKDTLYGLTGCRGDLSSDACLSCIAQAARKLPAACPGQADARIWYDQCFLRYDTDDFFGTLDTGRGLIFINVANATDPAKFDDAVAELMGTVSKAASVPGNKRFAWGLRAFEANVTIRGMAQCTRDLPASTCEQCLASAVGLFPNYCRFRQGCRVIYSSCVVRYEIYDFLFTDVNSYSSSVSTVPIYKITTP